MNCSSHWLHSDLAKCLYDMYFAGLCFQHTWLFVCTSVFIQERLELRWQWDAVGVERRLLYNLSQSWVASYETERGLAWLPCKKVLHCCDIALPSTVENRKLTRKWAPPFVLFLLWHFRRKECKDFGFGTVAFYTCYRLMIKETTRRISYTRPHQAETSKL